MTALSELRGLVEAYKEYKAGHKLKNGSYLMGREKYQMLKDNFQHLSEKWTAQHGADLIAEVKALRAAVADLDYDVAKCNTVGMQYFPTVAQQKHAATIAAVNGRE